MVSPAAVESFETFSFGVVTPTGLALSEPEPTWGALEAAWASLPRRLTGYQWAQGDLWILTKGVYGEDAAQMVENRGLDPSDLQSFAWVASKFVWLPADADESHPQWDLRRREGVSFSHHRAVAGLVGESDAATSLAVELIDWAESDPEVTKADLEERVREFRGDELDSLDDDGDDVSFSTGTLVQRLEGWHKKGDNILADFPADLDVERKLVMDALDNVGDAIASLRNRDAGGGASVSADAEGGE